MTPPRIYLETTMFNFPFADDSPQYRDDTRRLFEEIKTGKFTPYTSTYATDELKATQNVELRTKMIGLIPEHDIKILESAEGVDRLASLYIAGEAIPVGFYTDALHIAMTAIYGLDFIVSLNFQHIVRDWTIERVGAINAREGYGRIGIYKPGEVINDGKNS
jgi:predicted nucleic acid-binding protein